MNPLGAEFEEWYELSHPAVLAAVTAFCGDENVARDATDEAFVRALERWPRVSRMRSPVGWTAVVGLNQARAHHRRRAVEVRLWRARTERPGAAPSEPQLAVLGMWPELARLPRRQREVIALRYWADLPEAEIARVLHITRGAVSSRLTTARQAIRSTLDDEREQRHGSPHDQRGADPRPAQRLPAPGGEVG